MLAERLRSTIETQRFELLDGSVITVTLSIGFALYPFFPLNNNENWRDAMHLADRALYAVKRSGRNAWAGLWGTEKTTGTTIQDIHEDPEHAMKNGWIEISTSKPLVWKAEAIPAAQEEDTVSGAARSVGNE